MANATGLARVGTPQDPIRCAILISGSGSGMQAMLNHQSDANCSHYTALVISNKPDVGGIVRAQEFDIPVEVVEVPAIEDRVLARHQHEEKIEKLLQQYEVELIILSGYMRLLSEQFINNWAGQVVNIHPSLLPEFPGAHAHRDVIAAGALQSQTSTWRGHHSLLGFSLHAQTSTCQFHHPLLGFPHLLCQFPHPLLGFPHPSSSPSNGALVCQ